MPPTHSTTIVFISTLLFFSLPYYNLLLRYPLFFTLYVLLSLPSLSRRHLRQRESMTFFRGQKTDFVINFGLL